jgi:hypothetical protein
VWYGSITILKEVTFDGILKPTTKIYETGWIWEKAGGYSVQQSTFYPV